MEQRSGPARAIDVAQAAGVSQSAVSRTFTPGASVAAATRARVIAAADALGYRPNIIARSLSTQRSRIIGVAAADMANPFYAAFVAGLCDRLHGAGYHALLFTAPPGESGDPDLADVLAYQVDALVLAATTLSSRLAGLCRAAGVPVLLFNRTGDDPDVASVTGDNAGGGRAIAAHVAAAGYRRPAVVTGTPDASTSRDRAAAFAAGCAAHGLPAPLSAVGHYTEEGARQAARELLAGHPRPDVIFCANDHMALAVLELLRFGLGLAVPDQIGVIGFDDIDLAARPSFALTSFSQPLGPMLDVALPLIDTLIERRDEPRHVVVPGRLIVRGTTRAMSVMPAEAGISEKPGATLQTTRSRPPPG